MEKKRVCKKIFAQRLKRLIESNNETIYTVAELVHLTPATISRYTTADMAPKITTIQVLAEHFKVNPVWLMGYDVSQQLEPKVEKEKSPLETIAAHYDGKELTEDEIKEIENYIQYLLSKREK